MSIIISEDIRNDILECLGYPIVDVEEIYAIYPKAFIDRIIEKQLHVWYSYFPKICKKIIGANVVEQEIDVPCENCLGILNYCEINSSENETNNVLLKLSRSASSANTYGSQFNYFQETSGYEKYQNLFLKQSENNLSKSYYVELTSNNKKLIIKNASNKSLQVEFACFDSDVNNIPLGEYLSKFEDLCKSELMYSFGYKLSMMNSDLPLSFDSEALKEEGKDLKKEVLLWMSNNSTIPVIVY